METDYISREAAVKIALTYHAAHNITLSPGTYKSGFGCGANLREQDIVIGLRTLPAADVRPVVLCWDCRFYSNGFCYNPNTFDDEKTRGNTSPEWFCADGRRREGGTPTEYAVPSLGFPGGGCSLDIFFVSDIMKPKGKSRNWRKNEQQKESGL